MVKSKKALVAVGALLLVALSAASGGAVSKALEKPEIPGSVVLESLSSIYEPVWLNHAMHIYLADDCSVCHHEHMRQAEISCKRCHDLNPTAFRQSVVNKFMPCRFCHSEPDPGAPEMPSLKVAYHRACFQCHVFNDEIGTGPGGCTKKCHARVEK